MDTVGSARPGFRADIEGLRAVAVLTVLGFHAAVPHLGGGYVGVDVFFAISGFLITGLLVAELSRTGRVSLAEFYARRARRILPAAGLVLVATALAGWVLLPPLRQRDVAADVLAAALHVGNWRFVATETDYLHAGDPSPLLHYWSLGVEEQFYLLWAPVLALVAYLARRRPLLVVAGVLVAGTAASFALSLHWTETSGPLAYLSSPSRAWQFGVGGLAALAAPWAARVPVWARGVLGAAGLAAIGASTALFTSQTPFPGTAALAPTLGAVAVLLSNAGPARSLLTLAPVRLVGRLSFAWYLWHWPVLVLAEAAQGPLDWPVKLALVLGAGLPAAATLWLVERPVRFSVSISAFPRRGLAIGAAAVVLPLIAGLLLGTDAARGLGTGGGRVPSLAEFTAAATSGVPGVRGPVVPPPAAARVDYGPLPGECLVAPAAVESPPCRFGAGSAGAVSADRIVLLGDSQAAQWFPAVLQLAGRRGLGVEVLTKQGCPLATLSVVNPQLGREYRECAEWRRHALGRVNAWPKPKLVLVASLNAYVPDPRAGWDATLAGLGDLNVGYLRATPLPGRDIPTCVSGALDDWRACQFPRAAALRPDPLAERPPAGVRVVDVNDLLCPAEQCPAVIGGVLLYRDDSHLTATLTTLLAPRIDQLLEQRGLLGGTGWQQVWRDDFDGTALSTRDWLYDLGTCYPGCPAQNWGTGEVETMTAEAVTVAGGRLAITPTLKDGRWTSGRIETRRADFATPRSGTLRVEASIQLPQVDPGNGAGYWPAFWMLGDRLRDGYTGWPGVGELDIVEQLNGRPGVLATMHCGVYQGGPCAEPKGLGGGERPCAACVTGFHSYAVELEAAEVRWYVDGVLTQTVRADSVDAATWRQATDHGFFLILNVAVGGTMPGGPNAATVSGKPMLVDWVSVTSRAGGG
ncbi:acyltransferase family protein [Longispora sp. NPDC051575]|uniref:acyltransferase family protein n=1 Tax=Longispora sp. NPDC051575 TaxID=3154943 RepID=UPI00342D734B